MKRFWIIAVAAGILHSEPLVNGPKLGYISTASGIRGVFGIVGASRLGDTLSAVAANAVILPGQEIAFGVVAGELTRLSLIDGASSPLSIKNLDRLAASPSGESVMALSGREAVVFSKTGERIAGHSLERSPLLTAVDDAGKTVAFTTREAESDALQVLIEGTGRRVFSAPRIAGVAFIPGSSDLVFADGEGVVYILKGGLSLSRIGVVVGVTALAATPDQAIVLAGRHVYSIPLNGSEGTSIECFRDASSITPLGDRKFLLTKENGGLIWVVDASTDELRAAFVPEAVNE